MDTLVVFQTIVGGATEWAHLTFEGEVGRSRKEEWQLGETRVRRDLLRANPTIANATPPSNPWSTHFVDSLEMTDQGLFRRCPVLGDEDRSTAGFRAAKNITQGKDKVKNVVNAASGIRSCGQTANGRTESTLGGTLRAVDGRRVLPISRKRWPGLDEVFAGTIMRVERNSRGATARGLTR